MSVCGGCGRIAAVVKGSYVSRLQRSGGLCGAGLLHSMVYATTSAKSVHGFDSVTNFISFESDETTMAFKAQPPAVPA